MQKHQLFLYSFSNSVRTQEIMYLVMPVTLIMLTIQIARLMIELDRYDIITLAPPCPLFDALKD